MKKGLKRMLALALMLCLPALGAARSEGMAQVQPVLWLRFASLVARESQTPGATAEPQSTQTPISTPETTAEPQPTHTPVPTASATAEPQPTATPAPTASATAEPQPTATPVPTASATPVPQDCTHSNVLADVQPREVVYSDPDEGGHTCSYFAVDVITCLDCGAQWEEWPEKKTSQRESHTLKDGVCSQCGYVDDCPHENVLDQEVSYELTYSDADEQGHAVSYYAVTAHECQDCGKYWEDPWPAEKTWRREAHEYENGVCSRCGYENTCPHAHTAQYEDRRQVAYSDPDEGGHTLSYYAVQVTLCGDCGERWEDWPQQKTTVRQQHSYADGKCGACGYPMPAPTATATAQPTDTPAPTATAQPTGTPEPTVTAQPTQAPGPTATATAQPTETPEPTMPVVTDQPRPTAKPTSRPTARPTSRPADTVAPQPSFVPVDADAQVHGVRVEDTPPMAQALLTVAQELESAPAGTSVRIAHLSQVLTPEEYEALEQLPLREQFMAFLYAMGFEDEVNAALETASEGFSESALALKAQIQARLGAMNRAQRSEYAALLSRYFPMEARQVNGVETHWFQLDLELEDASGARVERYGFGRVNGAWVLCQVEIAQ